MVSGVPRGRSTVVPAPSSTQELEDVGLGTVYKCESVAYSRTNNADPLLPATKNRSRSPWITSFFLGAIWATANAFDSGRLLARVSKLGIYCAPAPVSEAFTADAVRDCFAKEAQRAPRHNLETLVMIGETRSILHVLLSDPGSAVAS